jgi:hypothetical protein
MRSMRNGERSSQYAPDSYREGNRQEYQILAQGIVRFTILMVLSLCASQVSGQIPPDSLYIKYNLVREEDNVIQNEAYLEEFFESLFQQRALNDRKINIVHIGDSHIQADILTAIVRRNLQQEFGNAGRGLIVPLRVAGTNEPFNFITRSEVKWNSKRCVAVSDPLPIGVGGITIHTDKADAEIEIYMNDLWSDYSFSNVTLFFLRHQTSFDFSIQDTARHELAAIRIADSPSSVNYSTVVLPTAMDAMKLKSIKKTEDQKQATIFGFNFANNKNGILYHVVGVNGAKYEHYNAASLFAGQTAGLHPEIFIISLGTNEAISYPYLDNNFYRQIDKLVSSLRANNPHAKFILVTPPDAFRKKTKHNPGVGIIRQQIIQYAVENGLAFYDMYKVCGGDQSSQGWRQSGLLRSDGVHFTRQGYEYQGQLLFYAFMRSYNNYVSLRHP